MVSKILQKMEYLLGFIQIPSSVRFELIGNIRLPYTTTLNGCRARIDKYGRLWSPYLRKRFQVGTKVEIVKTDEGYSVFSTEANKGSNSFKVKQKDKDTFVSFNQGKEMEAFAPEPYFQSGSIYIFNDDILRTKAIENNSIDLVVTSPPYDVDIKYENYDDSIPYDQYLEFTRKWLR
ncbi:MAG: hypothetical protein KIH09_16980, partial [Candidatus Freyarchaeota archaeon]|nr:hypothetical protein [Candidatus Jordarchaeia archaeon]